MDGTLSIVCFKNNYIKFNSDTKMWQGVDFDEAVAYQKTIPATKRFGAKLQKATEEGVTLIQPRAGVALYEEHIKLLQFLETEGEADLLPTTIDSYTRLNRYQEAVRHNRGAIPRQRSYTAHIL